MSWCLIYGVNFVSTVLNKIQKIFDCCQYKTKRLKWRQSTPGSALFKWEEESARMGLTIIFKNLGKKNTTSVDRYQTIPDSKIPSSSSISKRTAVMTSLKKCACF